MTDPLYRRRVLPSGRFRYDLAGVEWPDVLPPGTHLVVVKPGLKSTLIDIDPAHAHVLAAAKTARDAMLHAMSKACLCRPSTRWLGDDPVHVEAWDAYASVLAKHGRKPAQIAFDGVSTGDVIDAGIAALEAAAREQGCTCRCLPGVCRGECAGGER